jgi:hypothetical protein
VNKERLQEIKYRHAIGVETIPEELEWLISEVERLQMVLNHIYVITQGDNYYNALLQIESVSKQALETEETA